jgi:DNA-binding NarL/FixJ family response regulator
VCRATGVRAELRGTFDVVGRASSVAEAREAVPATSPDVVLLDVHLPDGNGADVVEALSAAVPDVRFLALSVSGAAEDVIGVIRAGARGYVTKSIAPAQLAGRSDASTTAMPSSRHDWRGSSSTRSRARPHRRWIPSSTSSRRGNGRSCV